MPDANHDTAPSLPTGVALTAAAMAQERAVESDRADGLVSDPWARELVDAAVAGVDPTAELATFVRAGGVLGDLVPELAGYVPLRTRWLDDAVLAAVDAGAGQVVLLGAGLDTRALRLAWPRPVSVFALDQPGVVAFTRHVLAEVVPSPTVRSVVLPVDLADRWTGELLDAGFDPASATAWVIEGLLMYLPPDQVDELVAAVRELSAPGSTVLADLAHSGVRDGGAFTDGQRYLQDNGSPLRSAVTDPVAWYAERGWTATVVDTAALAGGLGRPVPPAVDPGAPGGPLFRFTAARPR